MSYRIVDSGGSLSFPSSHPFLDCARDEGAAVVFLGKDAGAALRSAALATDVPFAAVELGHECLETHIGGTANGRVARIVGFARFRLGQAEPSALIELVRLEQTDADAVQEARNAFESAGLKVAVCGDFPGRIVNRLVRPYFNAALRRLDDGLASANDLDKTLRLGLGYPEGPIQLLKRSGLAEHCRASNVLYQQLGDPSFAPARRAQVALQQEAFANEARDPRKEAS